MESQKETTTIFYSSENEGLIAYDSNKNPIKVPNGDKRPKKIVLFGATGGTGLQIVEQGLLAGHKITAACRNPSALEKYKDNILIRKLDLSDRDAIEEVIKGADVVVSSLGTGTNLKEVAKKTTVYSAPAILILDAMRKHGVKRGIFVTSVGTEYTDEFPWFYKNILRPYIMNSYMDMMKLETIIERTVYPIDWTIVRPTELIDSKKSKTFHVTNRKTNGGNYKISRRDLAKFIIHELENDLWIHKYPAMCY
jgi:putative NADH-flavin reductase